MDVGRIFMSVKSERLSPIEPIRRAVNAGDSIHSMTSRPNKRNFMNEQQAIDKRLPVSQHPVCEPANFVRPTLFVKH